MKNIVIVDIDGTIAKIGDRLEYITNQNPKDYNAFYDHVEEDQPICDILDIVVELARSYRIVFCTGRDERCRPQTEAIISACLWITNC